MMLNNANAMQEHSECFKVVHAPYPSPTPSPYPSQKYIATVSYTSITRILEGIL